MDERLLKLMDEKIIKPVNVVKHLDEFLSNIDEHIENFFALVLESSKVNKIISFKKLMRNRTIIEIIRSFIMLLFLAHKGKIRIFQDGEFNDIYIQVVEASSPIG
jgi:chromatin segregation and condensation protein Rec8/ScpA/Scc1 (kleisin family)